jgi:hypothetical protein
MTIKKSVFFSKFCDVFTLAPPLLFKSRPVFTAPLNGRTVKSNVDASFSLKWSPAQIVRFSRNSAHDLILSHDHMNYGKTEKSAHFANPFKSLASSHKKGFADQTGGFRSCLHCTVTTPPQSFVGGHPS